MGTSFVAPTLPKIAHVKNFPPLGHISDQCRRPYLLDPVRRPYSNRRVYDCGLGIFDDGKHLGGKHRAEAAQASSANEAAFGAVLATGQKVSGGYSKRIFER